MSANPHRTTKETMARMGGEAEDLEVSFMWFAREILKMTGDKEPYEWQDDTVTMFDRVAAEMVLASLATPNGSGKSSVVIPIIVLGILFFYPRGRVVLTTADGKQLDGQVMPAINEHRAKFPAWKFIEREIITPTGGRFVCFTTDESGRAEGWHKIDDDEGPLVIIVDEGKSVPEPIFQAIDRCTYNGLLITSSPGKMSGYFYESQFKPELGFTAIRIGLEDCPHITQDKIDRIIRKWGPNSPYTRSTLHGEFLEIYNGDPVFYAYSMEAHEKEELGWPFGATLVVGMDGGTHNASVIMAVKEDANHRTHIWVLREIILTGSDTDRQAVELLKVLANEFPFWNSNSELCPQTLFFCDPALRNSAFTTSEYTAKGSAASALKVLHSHEIHPGFTIGMGLQPSIAVVNRMLQNNHAVETIEFKTGEKTIRSAWNFQIDKNECPTLCDGFRGRYRYPVSGEPGWGKDIPLKGDACQHVDHPMDALRYGICNVMALAEEAHPEGMRSHSPKPENVEPSRAI
jgi:hypothetical protein